MQKWGGEVSCSYEGSKCLQKLMAGKLLQELFIPIELRTNSCVP